MDVIGNNISNVNTTGFKSSRVTFSNMISQNLTGASAPNGSIGGTNPKQIGLGSAVSHSVAGHESTQVLTGKDGTVTTLKMPVSTLTFDVNGKYKTGSGQPVLTMTNGSESPQTVNLDYSALTQYAGSNTIAGKADGNRSGTLTSVFIDKTGTITGTYTNGMRKTEAQVALQRFTNPGGLTKIGNSLYEDSNNAGKSGELTTAATVGATITPSALEMSNVDVANEFTDMIITQRGFQSNSKIITVSDEMLETLVNMKR